MERTYHLVEKNDSCGLAEFLVKNEQGLLPMVELIEQSQRAVDELIEVVGRATIEAVLKLSAQGIAGPPHPGKKGGAVGWHGREKGTVCLRERKLRVERPRLRKKPAGEGGEVPLPAYEAMRAKGEAGKPDAGDSAARGVDAAVRRGLTADGGDGGSIEVKRQSARDRGERGRVAALVRAPAGGSGVGCQSAPGAGGDVHRK